MLDVAMFISVRGHTLEDFVVLALVEAHGIAGWDATGGEVFGLVGRA